MHAKTTLAAIGLLAAALSAQAYRDHFNYPNGTVVPGWTQQRGAWQVLNGRLSATSGATWAYITKDNLSARRCVLDGEFFFTGTGIQFGGLTTLHPGGSLDNDLLMVKIQNNGGAADFDRVYSYERVVGSAVYADIPGGTLAAYCRMVTLGNEFWIETDANRDGLYELVLPPRAIMNAHNGTLVGMNAYQTTEMDNFEFFDAVLTPQPGAVPRVGQNYGLRLATPSPNAAWIGMLALGNQAWALGNRAVPVSPDFLAVATIADPGFGMVGMTDANGDSTMTIPIPPMPFLVGWRVYACALTLDSTQPFGVGNISNEQGFVIQS